MGTKTYELTFISMWNDPNVNNRHFSQPIGGTHDADADFWSEGELASAGIKAMAELGDPNPLSAEVQTAIDAGDADDIILADGIPNSPGKTSVIFVAKPSHPLVSVTSMLAPSPDWFVGLDAVSLCEDGEWLEMLMLPAEVWDAGTDSGPDYNSPNDPTNPPEAIAHQPLFIENDEPVPVGQFLLLKL